MITESYLQIRSDSIIQYNLAPREVFKSVSRLESIAKFKEVDTYTGELTPGAKKRLTKAIELLVMSSKRREIYNPVSKNMQPFQLSFITLTFSDSNRIIPGKEAHRLCLEPFLQWLRRVHKCYSYVWKAEFQTKERVQLHYHITCDTFIHWEEIRNKWNELQSRAGYMNEYYKEKGHYDANSTDVHSTKHVRKLGRYLIKAVVKEMGIVGEMGKDLQNDFSVNGKVWDCSLNLKNTPYYTTVADWDYSERISKAIKNGYIEAFYTDHCNIFKFKKHNAAVILRDTDWFNYSELMSTITERELRPVRKIKPPKEDIWLEVVSSGPKKVNFVASPTLFSTS